MTRIYQHRLSNVLYVRDEEGPEMLHQAGACQIAVEKFSGVLAECLQSCPNSINQKVILCVDDENGRQIMSLQLLVNICDLKNI
jgi:hypothetical protein